MSMLAERKTKQKWSLNPRGKAWSEDSSKFGQKMLEKMGWSKGKGLGPRENGICEHVKIPYKNDSKGMGYKDRNDQWTEHDTNFSALLQSLSGEKPPENSVTGSSLEAKSQNSRVRVHYKKFTRGKDVSRWSEKDLANIFGKRSLKDSPKVSTCEDSNETKENQTDSGFARNSGSMVDYFKKKLPNFGKTNSYVVGNNGVLTKMEESEDEDRVGFGFEKKRAGDDVVNGTPKKMRMEVGEEEKGLMNPAFDPMHSNIEVQKHVLNTIVEESEECEVHIKKNKIKLEIVTSENTCDNSNTKQEKKKKKKTGQAEGITENMFEIAEQEIGKNDSEECQKKKKKKRSAPMDNPSFEENDDKNMDIQTNDTFEVKRKKKRKTKTNLVETENEHSSQNGSIHTEVKVNKKKKSAVSPGIDNPNFDNLENVESNSHNSDYEVKRSQKKNENSGIENPNFDYMEESPVNSHNNDYEVKRKKKKKNLNSENTNFNEVEECQNNSHGYEVKKRKKKTDNCGIENPDFNVLESSQNSCQNNEYEVKRKKNKGSESSGVENPNFDIMDASQNSYNDSTFEVKRKKKKKKDVAVDNPSFTACSDDSQISKREVSEDKTQEEPCLDLVLNITSTPSLPKAESSKQSSTKKRKNVRFSHVNEERIISNNEDIENRNELFDINSRVISDGLNDTSTNLDLDEISKKIDGFQAEVENDINEAKVNKFIGEVGSPDGENEKLPEGTKLKFKNANFGKVPVFINRNTSRAKTSYKHLIKGDIILGFKNTNLHEIVGYGVKK
ncbi:hypothetical protein Zmor_017997 [Zophobas morio]|uniref:G-patch domain-containing protein n=1 Tax=Zophobas morio TaxID=2755281 RepID=A0AA38MCQ3_9CUCU|nr:hypothetical protein Zmor_017997 [Zophobas morio]